MPEYQLVVPPPEIITESQGILLRTQNQRSDPNNIYIPTGFGTLVAENGHRVFSVRNVGVGEIYDLVPLPGEISGAETTGVSFCGVSFGRIGNFRFLAHAAGPRLLTVLTGRAVDLITELGGTLPTGATVNVGFNNTETGLGSSDLGRYRQSIEDLFIRRGLTYTVRPYLLEHLSPIVQT